MLTILEWETQKLNNHHKNLHTKSVSCLMFRRLLWPTFHWPHLILACFKRFAKTQRSRRNRLLKSAFNTDILSGFTLFACLYERMNQQKKVSRVHKPRWFTTKNFSLHSTLLFCFKRFYKLFIKTNFISLGRKKNLLTRSLFLWHFYFATTQHELG